MTELLVGLDAGGSKLAIRAEDAHGAAICDVELRAVGWEAEPANTAVEWLLSRLADVLPAGGMIAALGLGAQGCDNPAVKAEITAGFQARGIRASVVNDAALLVPAAGLDTGLGVIAGTGAIAVGVDETGLDLAAGGWGWVLGDDAGGVGIVREAVKRALFRHDAGEPDDGLLAFLLEAFDVTTAERLARAVNDTPTIENWAPHAPAVFAAADAGSADAAEVVLAGATHLATLVDQLLRRGAVGETVVCAGSIILQQQRLFEAFANSLGRSHPQLAVRRLDDRPVAGALVLARRIASAV